MKVERISNTHVKYSFVVSAHDFDHGLEHAFNKVQKNVEIDGFRKGKVPRKIFENKYGVESLYEEALNHVIHHLNHDIMNDDQYEVVATPKVELDIEKIKVGEPFDIHLVAAVKPEFELGQYKEIPATKVDVTVTDLEIDQEITALISSKSELQPKEGSLENGNTAIFDFEGFLDGVPFEGGKAENYSLEIGSNQFIPGFEAQMVGMLPGEEKDLNVTFPEQYQAENLAGKDVIFKVKLHEVKIKVTPELTDELVLSLNKENVSTIDELKASIKSDLTNKKENDAKSKTSEEVINQLLENTPIEIPQEMVDQEMKYAYQNVEQQAKRYGLEVDMFLQLSGINKEEFDKQVEVESRKRVQTTLIIEKIAKVENIQVEESEINAKYEELSKQYNMPVEEVKKHIDIQSMTFDLTLNRAYQLVLDSAVIK